MECNCQGGTFDHALACVSSCVAYGRNLPAAVRGSVCVDGTAWLVQGPMVQGLRGATTTAAAPVAASRRWCTTSIPRSTGVRDLTLPSCTGSGDAFDHAGSHMSCRAGAGPLRSCSAPGETAVITLGEFDEIAVTATSEL